MVFAKPDVLLQWLSWGSHLPWQVRGNAENEESTLPVLAKKGDAIPESVLAKSYLADGSIAGENQQDGAAVVIEGIVAHPSSLADGVDSASTGFR